MSKLFALFSQVNQNQNSGDTQWIISSAKNISNCRIIYGTPELAESKKVDYVHWFVQTYNRPPKAEEIPQFCSIGGMLHHDIYGQQSSLVVDNSCFDMRYLDEFKALIYNDIRKELHREKREIQQSVIRKTIELIKNTGFITFIFNKKKLISDIETIKYQLYES